MAISGGSGSFFDSGNNGLDRPGRHILRFGAKIKGEDVPSVPERYRGLDGPTGKVLGVRLVPTTGDLWLRLVRMNYRPPFERIIRTIPLNERQSPAPSPEALELRSGMRVYCHDGYVGRMEGVTFNAASGVAIELIVRVRSDVLTDVQTMSSPMAKLIPAAGQRMLLSPAWAASVKQIPSTLPFRSPSLALHLEATPEQIASGSALRSDEAVAADIWSILNENPALAPYTGHIHLDVHDGAVHLTGTLPTRRHRASAQQDIWHVPGVFALYDETTVSA